MFEITGKYATALITTDDIEEEAIAQITELVNSPASMNSKIVIMPDVHAGKGCVIGTTMTITDRVVPNLVGVDIGCGVSAYPINVDGPIDFEAVQAAINKCVPSGFNVHEQEDYYTTHLIKQLRLPIPKQAHSRIVRSLGTLGGGNHFISIEVDSKTAKPFLVIHTGSRSLGTLIARHYQEIAEKHTMAKASAKLIEKLKMDGKFSEIQAKLEAFKRESTDFAKNKELAFLTGTDMEDYLHDMQVAQRFAHLNRVQIAHAIFLELGWEMPYDHIESVHNYIEIDEKGTILRKGAVATDGDYFLVPLNMKDGTLVYEGRKNPDWNFSGPHGAGRRMSRSTAKKTLSLDEFKESMQGIWSASVGQSTLDEAPPAYKEWESIAGALDEQYTLVHHLIPVFNFKASDEVE